MNKPWQDKLRQIDPYIPGEQSKDPEIIKLNANENPYPPSPRVSEVLTHFKADHLRKYPESDAGLLRDKLAQYYGVGQDQIFMGNGSDDVLALCFQSFFCSDVPILFPDITYSFYPVWCALFRTPYKTIPLDADFRIHPQDYACKNGGVILPNPNAPTGIGEGLAFIEQLLQANPDSIVIIDEAYIDFGGQSALPLLHKYENLVIVQTMSKSRSLAGLRVGYAIANPALIATLEAVKNSYNSYTMDSVAIEAAAASIDDDPYFRQICAQIMDTRTYTTQELTRLGFSVVPSLSNFVLCTHPDMKANDIFHQLKAKKIMVRYFNLPRIDNHLRITIGTNDEMDTLLSALREILNK